MSPKVIKWRVSYCFKEKPPPGDLTHAREPSPAALLRGNSTGGTTGLEEPEEMRG